MPILSFIASIPAFILGFVFLTVLAITGTVNEIKNGITGAFGAHTLSAPIVKTFECENGFSWEAKSYEVMVPAAAEMITPPPTKQQCFTLKLYYNGALVLNSHCDTVNDITGAEESLLDPIESLPKAEMVQTAYKRVETSLSHFVDSTPIQGADLEMTRYVQVPPGNIPSNLNVALDCLRTKVSPELTAQ